MGGPSKVEKVFGNLKTATANRGFYKSIKKGIIISSIAETALGIERKLGTADPDLQPGGPSVGTLH